MKKCPAILCFVFVLFFSATGQAKGVPGRFAGNGIVIGLEYAVLDHPGLVKNMAETFAETGMPGMKHFAEAIQWDRMQKAPNAPIDFTTSDLFVRTYQENGFTELTLCLKPHCSWGSKGVPWLGKATNTAPKPEFRDRFRKWIAAVVERYDGDGKEDMPGLRWPVRFVEIGSEFSSYEPEPVDDYLDVLKMAHEAAHQAFDQVLIGNAAFLITPVNLDVSNPADYEKAWAGTDLRDRHHGLADQRRVLDHPEMFDFINVHNLGDPYEIESIMKWLTFETAKRGYSKPVVISDTCPTSFIGWGPATTTRGKKLGLIAAPAQESDRARLAVFFQKMVRGDKSTLNWARGFIAGDHVKRAVIAAEQGIKLINLSFTADLPLLTTPILQAGAGLSAWGGAGRFQLWSGRIQEKYPLFFALGQLTRYLDGYESLTRVPFPDDRIRVYQIRKRAGGSWVAWFNPKALVLPEDGNPVVKCSLKTGLERVRIEPVIDVMGRTTPETRESACINGILDLNLSANPVFISPF